MNPPLLETDWFFRTKARNGRWWESPVALREPRTTVLSTTVALPAIESVRGKSGRSAEADSLCCGPTLTVVESTQLLTTISLCEAACDAEGHAKCRGSGQSGQSYFV